MEVAGRWYKVVKLVKVIQKLVRSSKVGKIWWKVVKFGKNAFCACQWYKKFG